MGTRLRPVVADRPKILAPIHGHPILHWQLNWLAYFGPRRVILSLGYMAEKVRNYLEEDSDWDFEVCTITEPEPLGTGGALLYCSPRCTQNSLLVLNGDTLLHVDLCHFVEFHYQTGRAASLICAEVDDASRYGRVVVKNGRITEFHEKDEVIGRRPYVSAGGYLFDRKLIDQLPIPTSCSLENDILPLIIENGISAYVDRVRFLDIGTPEGMLLADRTWGEYSSSSLR